MKQKKKQIRYLLIFMILLGSCQSTKDSKVASNPDDINGKKVYNNPVDGKQYVTEGEWKNYSPDTERKNRGTIDMQQVILLTEQNAIAEMISIDYLAEYIQKTEDIVKECLSESDGNGELLLQVTLKSDSSPSLDISVKGKLEEDKITSIYKQMETLNSYKTEKDSCIFQLHFKVTGS